MEFFPPTQLLGKQGNRLSRQVKGFFSVLKTFFNAILAEWYRIAQLKIPTVCTKEFADVTTKRKELQYCTVDRYEYKHPVLYQNAIVTRYLLTIPCHTIKIRFVSPAILYCIYIQYNPRAPSEM